MLMFYRNSSGRLRYLRDLGWGWVGPYGPPGALDYTVDGDVSATWDSSAGKFQIAFRSGGLARVMALDATTWQFSQSGHMLSCSFATSSGDHTWAAPVTAVAHANNLLLLGGRSAWDSWSYYIEQARATRANPTSAWQFDAHSYIELVGTYADSSVFDNKWFMILWHDAPPGYSKTASVQWRSL